MKRGGGGSECSLLWTVSVTPYGKVYIMVMAGLSLSEAAEALRVLSGAAKVRRIRDVSRYLCCICN